MKNIKKQKFLYFFFKINLKRCKMLYNQLKINNEENNILQFFGIKKINAIPEKTYVIGDVHGNYILLKSLINKISKDKDIKIIFIGDIIEKGPDSLKTLFYIQKLIKNNPDKYKLIIGNHELRMLKYIINTCKKKDTNNIWYEKSMKNNDMEIINYFSKYPKKIKNLINFFEIYADIGILINEKFLLTHGYALPFVAIKNGNVIIKNKKEIIKNRNLKLKHKNTDIINIFGHIGKPLKTKNYICIDTAVYKTNKLGFINLQKLNIETFSLLSKNLKINQSFKQPI